MSSVFSSHTVRRAGPGFGIMTAVVFGALLMPIHASADLDDQPVSWAVFEDGTNVFPKTAGGEPLHDYESSADPSSGGTGVGADPIDIGSEWDGVDDPTAPHELCNPELSAVTPNGRCGTAVSAFWGYYPGTVPYDPNDPTDTDGDGLPDWAEDDVIFLRMRLVGSPAAGGGAHDFAANHWNFLIDTDGDGYKDYWLDLNGGFNQGSASNRIDRIQLLYEPTTVPEILCGGGGPTQLVQSSDDARVAEYTACAADWETMPVGHPCRNSHTRVVSVDSQYYLEVQLPLDALKALDCAGCPGPGGGPCNVGRQQVLPGDEGGAPEVSYFFSTGNSGVNPLQKDYIAQCELTGNPPDGPCSFPDPTPVTLASVRSERRGSAVAVEWTTATQTGVVGFNLYAVTDHGWRRLNQTLIPAGPASTGVAQHFSHEALAAADVEAIAIEDVDVFGRSRRHGPFPVGAELGRRPSRRAIDWGSVRAELKADRSEIKSSPAGRREQPVPEVDLLIDRDGLYRVTYERLAGAGHDFGGVPADQLAVIGRDGPVPILVTGGPSFGPGSAIELVGRALDSLYTRTDRLRLTVDPTAARRIATEERPPKFFPPTPWYTAVRSVERQRDYSYSTPVDDPWFDTSMLAYTSPKEWSFELTADHLVADVAAAEVVVRLWGGTDWPDAPDHHAVLLVNGFEVGDLIFDGLTAQQIAATIPPGVLQPGSNTLTIRLPGDTGVQWDLIQLDGYELRYPRAPVADGAAFELTADGPTLRVDDVPDNRVSVYELSPRPVRITGIVIERSTTGYSVIFGGTEAPSDYLIVTDAGRLSPGLADAATGAPPLSGKNDLLIIAHPQFLGGLEPLISARMRDGLNVALVDVDDIYAGYSRGVVDPEAIRSYIADAAAVMGTESVLLVGGDTFDYHDYLGLGSISFIPSLYAATDVYITHAPADPLFGDVDGDDVPEVAVGRFPVRTAAELDSLVAKTLAFDELRGQPGTAVIAADAYDGALDLHFTGFADRLVDDLPETWQITRAYVDAVGFETARKALIEQIDSGATLTSYVGHSGPTMWSFDGLLVVDDVPRLHNAGRPTVALQWGCWNTYFVEPRFDSIGTALLLDGDHGAAAVVGATSLSWVPASRAFSELLGPLLTAPGVTIGSAITTAKRQLATSLTGVDDVVLGWTLLGDPTLSLERSGTRGRRR